MADAKIVNIKGVQWDLKDEMARNRIAELEKELSGESLDDIEINLNSGYTVLNASLVQHYKIGKIHFTKVEIRNISGENIGTERTAKIGSINLVPRKETNFLLYDYRNEKILRCYVDRDSSIRIGESNGVVQGDNVCYGELIFAEE